MDLKSLFNDSKAKLSAILRTRRLKAEMFSGTPIILTIERQRAHDSPVILLRYKNGLMLTLGDAGILDFQDVRFGHFMENRNFEQREFLILLHKIVLKSLLKYLLHPGLDKAQRETAAEGISKLWLAYDEDSRPRASSPEKFLVHM
jgi:hypothetical protein